MLRVPPFGHYRFHYGEKIFQNPFDHEILVPNAKACGAPLRLKTWREAAGCRAEVFDPTPRMDAAEADLAAKAFCQGLRGAPKPTFPAFVPPERPADPAPVADTPIVATLKRLLADREGVLKEAGAEVEATQRNIDNLEAALTKRRADLDYRKSVAKAAEAEVVEIKVAIGKLD